MKRVSQINGLIVILLLVSCSPKEETQVTDIDGNNYEITSIGTQKWTTRNLIVKHYRNGDPIQQAMNMNVWDSLANAGIGAYCCISYYAPFESDYGLLYNWHTVHDPRGLAPTGWHIPTDNDWIILKDYLGGFSYAGQKMKSQHPPNDYWGCPDVSDNSSGFNAFPSGFAGTTGTFSPIDYGGFWWSSTETDIQNAIYWRVVPCDDGIYKLSGQKDMGMAVRLIKD